MRISAGELRGRRLGVGEGSRPTSERARSGLFDWIGPRIEGEDVLDLFAGSGALGIEALSRGARSAVFVERARPLVTQLRRNLRDLDLVDRSRVLGRDAIRSVSGLVREGLRFGFVFADPPYSRDWGVRLAKCPELLEILTPDGGLIFERSKRETPGVLAAGPGLALIDTRLYGETAFDWYESEPVTSDKVQDREQGGEG